MCFPFIWMAEGKLLINCVISRQKTSTFNEMTNIFQLDFIEDGF